MSEDTISDTQPSASNTLDETQKSTPPVKSPKSKVWMWIVGGILAVLLIGALGGLFGYYAGLSMRRAAEQNSRDLAASMQFQLGMADMGAGRYDFAKQRFEYVIQLNPLYPGVLENMARLTIIMNSTATPTIAPSLTAAPTLDLSGVEGLLSQAKQLTAAQDWNGSLAALDIIRKQNPTFKTLDVDGLYYINLRNRGLQKILNQGNLEGGIFDFALMRRFGPDDKETRDAAEWAALYLHAGGYFGWDWANAIKYFGEIYPYYPGLIDGSQRTVADRYRESLFRRADELMKKEKWCDAVPYYEQSLAIGQDNKVAESYTKAYNKCIASLPTATPTIDPSTIPTDAPTAEPTIEVPTEIPTVASP